MDKLVRAVLHLGSSGMEVVAERDGHLRKVNIVWHRQLSSDVPPKNWEKLVRAELDYQDSNPVPIPM